MIKFKMKGSKKMKRLFVAFMCLMVIMYLVGCKKEKQYTDDGIIIEIKSTYKDKFLNKEFELSDFNFQNIETYSYSKWYDAKNRGYIFIYLNKAGKNEIEEAMQHFKQLSFVQECEQMPIISLIE